MDTTTTPIATPTYPPTIDRFRGDFAFLSNFYVDQSTGFCAEVHYQARKAANPADKLFILARPDDPVRAKRLGRTIKLRPDWDLMKTAVMLDVLTEKFELNPLRTMLMDTGLTHLVETNDWGDTFWGVSNGAGQNMLGRQLMMLRRQLLEEGYF